MPVNFGGAIVAEREWGGERERVRQTTRNCDCAMTACKLTAMYLLFHLGEPTLSLRFILLLPKLQGSKAGCPARGYRHKVPIVEGASGTHPRRRSSCSAIVLACFSHMPKAAFSNAPPTSDREQLIPRLAHCSHCTLPCPQQHQDPATNSPTYPEQATSIEFPA
jgi:hypothetical protein